MAGYVLKNQEDERPVLGGFWIDTPDIARYVKTLSGEKRVVTLQLDGDELAAALWGLENYKK